MEFKVSLLATALKRPDGAGRDLLCKLLALTQCRLNDLESADIGEEVAYGVVGALVVGMGVVCALDGREAWVVAVGAIGTTRGAIGLSICLETIGFLVRAHGWW